jgi:putative lipoprotein
MRASFALVAAILLCGCAGSGVAPSGGGPAGQAKVTGTVAYMQRIALPPTATIKVSLVDVSRADAPSITIGEQVIQTAGRQVPFAFEIPYDPAKIEQRNSYAIQVRIEDAGKLLFISDTRHSVITRGAPTNVDIVVRPVGGPPPK